MPLRSECRVFLAHPRNMRVLILANAVYALVIPAIELFTTAYVMRCTRDIRLVMTYQVAVYAVIPIIFGLTGWMLKTVPIRHLYALGMLLSALAMAGLLTMPQPSLIGIVVVGTVMGCALGILWGSRNILALLCTDDGNRNYYFGIENVIAALAAVVVPVMVGGFIQASGNLSGSGAGMARDQHILHAYRLVSGAMVLLTVIAAFILYRGHFPNPPSLPEVARRLPRLWRGVQYVNVLRGLVQGFVITAPAMLVMKLMGGEEGTLGLLQSIGGVVAAMVLYGISRLAGPNHRVAIFVVGLAAFALGSLFNMILFNAAGVSLFMVCMLLGRPLIEVGGNPIMNRIIDILAQNTGLSPFAFFLNAEWCYFVGRLLGGTIFILVATGVSEDAALRYTLAGVAGLQMMAALVLPKALARCQALQADQETA